jgi:hypothetical protein
MAWSWGDGIDLYSAAADMVAGYWDSGAGAPTLVAGRFAGSQALNIQATTVSLTKSSGTNDAVHHLVVAFCQTAALSGTTLGAYLQLLDGTTGQCAIVFRSDGAILLTSGTAGGTTLATYTGAVTASNTWFGFEFEIVINNTTGSFNVRKNGNTSNDFSSGSIDTQNSANAYANKLTVGMQATVTAHQIDDLFWRSDASSVAWMGDLRCFTRMPASDASVQFSRPPINVAGTNPINSTTSKAADAGMMASFVAAFSGTIASGTVSIATGGTGNMKAAIYDATRTTVLATSNAVVNPVAGSNAITFGTPLTVTKGTTYYLAVDQDFTIVYSFCNNGFAFTTTYASFPAAGPTTTSFSAGPVFTLSISPTVNAEMVNEAQQDGATSYVYDSTVNDADFYNIGTIASTPASTIAVTTRGYMQKDDAGSRTASVQIKSGSTTVASPTLTLTTSGWQWAWRMDLVDPNTGAAWTASAVNAVNIGPKVIS